jgi:hypothetical protein
LDWITLLSLPIQLQGAAVALTQWLGVDGITADDDELLLAEAAINTANCAAAAAAAATAADITAALQDMRIEAQLIEVGQHTAFLMQCCV